MIGCYYRNYFVVDKLGVLEQCIFRLSFDNPEIDAVVIQCLFYLFGIADGE